jgi:hypothetical protein
MTDSGGGLYFGSRGSREPSERRTPAPQRSKRNSTGGKREVAFPSTSTRTVGSAEAVELLHAFTDDQALGRSGIDAIKQLTENPA